MDHGADDDPDLLDGRVGEHQVAVAPRRAVLCAMTDLRGLSAGPAYFVAVLPAQSVSVIVASGGRLTSSASTRTDHFLTPVPSRNSRR
jgi:hypothetical protein